MADRVRELTQFLVDDLEADVPADCGGCTVAYHYSCHGLRGLGLDHQADVLLAGTNCVSCLMHMEGGLRRRGSEIQVKHIAELLGDVPEGERREHNLTYKSVDAGCYGGRCRARREWQSHPHSRGWASQDGEPGTRVHIALLEADAIHRTLALWAHKNPESAVETTNLVFVTGPSKTGDIEQQLNLGVHGPRHVHIVMIK